VSLPSNCAAQDALASTTGRRRAHFAAPRASRSGLRPSGRKQLAAVLPRRLRWCRGRHGLPRRRSNVVASTSSREGRGRRVLRSIHSQPAPERSSTTTTLTRARTRAEEDSSLAPAAASRPVTPAQTPCTVIDVETRKARAGSPARVLSASTPRTPTTTPSIVVDVESRRARASRPPKHLLAARANAFVDDHVLHAGEDSC